jgi:hypothetical protein
MSHLGGRAQADGGVSLRRPTASGWALAVALLAALTLAMFSPLVSHLIHGGEPRWLEGDVAEEYWPDLVVLCRGLAEHHVPRWLAFEHGGMPFYADPQPAVYYPVNRAICALAGAAPSIHWADARVVLHFLIAGVCMALFLSFEGLALPAAVFGGALFELSPYFRHNWELNLTWGFAYFPLVLFAVRAACSRPTVLRGALLGIAVALLASVGSPPSLFFSMLGAALFGCHCMVTALRARTSPRALAVALSAALLTALGLLPALLLPAQELRTLSVQTGHDFLITSEGSVPLRDLAGVLLPTLTDHHYVGALTLALCPLAFLLPRALPSRWFFLGLAVFAALMIAGAHTPIYRLAYRLVPGVAVFRDPARYSSLYGAAMAVLAAGGLDALIGGELGARVRTRWAMASLLVALLAIVLGLVPALEPRTHGAGLLRAGGLLALGVAALWVAARFRWRALPWVVAAAIGGLGFADIFPYLVEDRHTRPWPVAEGHQTEETLRSMSPGLDRWRTYDEFGVGMRSGSRYGQRDLRGYQDPLSLSRYQKVLGALERTPALLAMFNVRWVLYGPHYAFGDWHHFIPDPTKGDWAVLRAPHVWELTAALPDAFWMDGAEVVPDKDVALTRLTQRTPAPTIVLESPDVLGLTVPAPSGAYVPCDAKVSGESVDISVDAPAAGFVLVNEVHYPGWIATVDGAPSPIYRANSLVRAVRVAAGRHRILMEFRPWQPVVLEPLALVTLGLVGLGAVAARARRRVPGPGSLAGDSRAG